LQFTLFWEAPPGRLWVDVPTEARLPTDWPEIRADPAAEGKAPVGPVFMELLDPGARVVTVPVATSWLYSTKKFSGRSTCA